MKIIVTKDGKVFKDNTLLKPRLFKGYLRVKINGPHQRTIQLDDAGGVLQQHPQRGIAAAEIIQCNEDPQLLARLHKAGQLLRLLVQTAFGQFCHQTGPGETVFFQSLFHEGQQLGIGELVETHIECQIKSRIVGLQPNAGRCRLLKYPAAYGVDQTDFLQNGNEGRRRCIVSNNSSFSVGEESNCGR